MKKFAVIDIGSNSVRLMFVADGTVLYKRLKTTRLGEGLTKAPFLKEEAIVRSAVAVTEFNRMALEEGAEQVLAFATAAVRSAKNGRAFVERVQALSGLRVEVVSGEEEATLGITGALGCGDGGIVDIGGASTEIIVRSNGETIYKKSIDIGVVRLKELCGEEEEALYAPSQEKVKLFGKVPKAVMYGIGGTATTAAALILGLTVYDSNRVHGSVISKVQIESLSKQLLDMPIEDIAALPCVAPGRADILKGGIVLLWTIMDTLGADRLVISDRDNLEGYAIRKGLL